MNIHEHIEEKTELAKIYAKDGAFITAAARLRTLADDIESHVNAVNAEFIKEHEPD